MSSLFTRQEDLSYSIDRACPGAGENFKRNTNSFVFVVSLDVEILHLWRMRVDCIGRSGVYGLLVLSTYSRTPRP